ncbi:MAG: nucleotide exchange factor GrpE [Candidatus Omnitrophica bacterium CG1_02_49_10]|nr:MAG: nucleotide exchange factor GrpE [Candidatus Omnitrophica bacterium CG1_02_49_10]
MNKEEKKVEISREEYELLKAEGGKAEEYLDRLHRLQAEFENARKRMDKDKIEFVKFSNESLIFQLLDVLDNLERSLSHSALENKESVVKGVEMVSKELSSILAKNGLDRIKTVGEKFDPNLHEAMMQMECEDKEDGVIVEEIAPGYMLNGRLLKPAAVKVCKKVEDK